MSQHLNKSLIDGNNLDLEQLSAFQQKPAPFTPGEPLFWDDVHISQQMLAAHLNPTHDLASRRPETIERTVNWIFETLGLKPGAAVLDLGCGPGLYAAQLAKHGLHVTGVDTSRRSIDYAESFAREHNLEITYRYQNYLTLEDRQQYDTALLIYGDFCPLSPIQRSQLLGNVQRALKPGGHFILDVTTRQHRKRYGNSMQWYVAEGGFWKPGIYLALEQGFDYPQQSIWLDQVIVIEANGKLSVYRNWFQDYQPETIIAELESGGFSVNGIWGDLTGTPYTDDSEWIGVVAQSGN